MSLTLSAADGWPTGFFRIHSCRDDVRAINDWISSSDDRCMNIRGVAEYTGYSENTIRALRRKGKLPQAHAPISRPVYRKKAIDRWMEDNRESDTRRRGRITYEKGVSLHGGKK